MEVRDNRRWAPLVGFVAAVLLMAGGGPAGAQEGELAAPDLAAHIVAGEAVELRGVRVVGDLVLPRATRAAAPVRCRECRFTGSVRAPEASFARGLDLEDSEVAGGLHLPGTSFDGWVNVEGLRVAGPASWQGARLAEALSARNGRFDGPLTFDRARVNGPVSFARASFGAGADFTGTEFAGRADFGQSRHAGEARFDDVVFGGPPTFALGQFGRRASFERAEFRAGGSFQFAHVADVSLERAVAAGKLTFDEMVVDGEVSLDGLTSSGEVALNGLRAGRRSLIVEQLVAADVTMDVDLVPAIAGRAAQKKMLRRAEMTAKAREDLSTANNARFHRLSMRGEEKDGLAGLVDDGNRFFAGYLVRPARPVASFAGLVAIGTFVRLAYKTFPRREKDKSTTEERAPAATSRAGSAAPVRATTKVHADERGSGRAAEPAVFVWRAFWKAVADALEAISDSLAAAFRLKPAVASPEDGEVRSYFVAAGGWVEYFTYKVALAVILLTIGNANPTVRELLESVRP